MNTQLEKNKQKKIKTFKDTRQLSNRPKIVLVTGGAGFIGSHFIELLLGKGYSVVNIDKMTYAANRDINNHFLKNHPGRYHFIKKDVNDLRQLPFCDAIVHFAAESHVDNSISNGDIFLRSNVLGTLNLLNLLVNTRKNNLSHSWGVTLPTFLHVNTDEVFGDIDEGFFKENDSFRPSNPYSASKAAAETYVMAYGRTYGLPYRITRTTNNYGPRQHFEKLVPHCVLSVLNNRSIKIHGSGEQRRNWIHVKDNCQAIFEVMRRGADGEIYNISSDEELSVNEVAEIILMALGKKFDSKNVVYIQDRSGQDTRYAIDSRKIQRFGWAPKHSFKDEIKNIIAFYKKNAAEFADRLENWVGVTGGSRGV